MPTEKLYAVDRVEGGRAVLVGDAGDVVTLALADLPDGVAEGTVLRVPVGRDGALEWGAARPDPAEAERRAEEARAILERLRRRDPGGDVEL